MLMAGKEPTLVEALFSFFRFTDIIDIVCVTVFVYSFLWLAVRGRSMDVVRGITWTVLGFVCAFGVAKLLNLTTVLMLFSYFWVSIIIIIAVVFQTEIRKVILDFGRMWFVQRLIFPENIDAINLLCASVMRLSKTKTGALICLQCSDSLEQFMQFGVKMNSELSDELIRTIFTPPAPLHDGAIVIHNDKILAAMCLLPLTDRKELPTELGTRHRAAIGATENTDAVVVVVSEESGRVSLCRAGRINIGFNSIADLRTEIQRLMKQTADEYQEEKTQTKTVVTTNILSQTDETGKLDKDKDKENSSIV